MLYDLSTGRVGASLAGPSAPSYGTCDPAVCVTPALAEQQLFPLGYLPGQYKDALISPDGRWIAFTAEYVYGPEDLLVISNE